MNRRLSLVKALLWGLLGVLAVVTFARFKSGLGATTHLSDAAPWGLWIAFDVMAGVALAAGGFVIAATVHVFRLERYHAFVRPAILTALIGYAAVAVGLLYDLGLPWHIWHPLVFPQAHSVLFEVAMCVMFYLTVLALEFSPVVLEHPRLDRPLFRKLRSFLVRFTIPLVIAGIVLSTLHQSSLGSLFLIAPYRLHALWYSPMIWVLFFVSAIGLGLSTVILESYFSHWLFGHRLPVDRLRGLARAAAVVLGLYLVLRLGDLALRGQLGAAFDGSAHGLIFLAELAVAALAPVLLLGSSKLRRSSWGIAAGAGLCVLGMIGYRFNVCLVAFARPEGATYFPSWIELAVTLGIVAAAVLTFITFVEHLRVYPDEEHAEEPGAGLGAFDPHGWRPMLPEVLAAPRRNSLAALTGAALALALLPGEALSGARPLATPVTAPRSLDGALLERADSLGHDLLLVTARTGLPANALATPLYALDGNRDGRLVLFPHDHHVEELGEDDSCVQCHHLNRPFERNSACSSCHTDMYSPVDLFSHSSHVASLEGNGGCVRCHEDDSLPKTRDTAVGCADCHADMLVEGTRVEAPQEGLVGLAPGYMEAMHGLCIDCHEERVALELARHHPEFGECRTCHRDADGSELRRLGPFATELADAAAAPESVARGGRP